MTNSTIAVPGGYVPAHALAFADSAGLAQPVSALAPLPAETMLSAAGSAPLAGTTTASATLGPFVPQLGRAIWVTLTGSWTGSVRVLRSTDGGATRLPLTVAGSAWGSFTGNANESIGEESVAGATWYLAVALSTGTLGYRVQQ